MLLIFYKRRLIDVTYWRMAQLYNNSIVLLLITCYQTKTVNMICFQNSLRNIHSFPRRSVDLKMT